MKTTGPSDGRDEESALPLDFFLSESDKDPSGNESTSSDVGGDMGELTVTTIADCCGEKTRGVVGEFLPSDSDSEPEARAGVGSGIVDGGVH